MSRPTRPVALGTPQDAEDLQHRRWSQEHAIKKHTDWVEAVAYSPDGKYLASGDRAGGGFWVGTQERHTKYTTARATRKADNRCLFPRAIRPSLPARVRMAPSALEHDRRHDGQIVPERPQRRRASIAFVHDGRDCFWRTGRWSRLWGPDGAAIKSLRAVQRSGESRRPFLVLMVIA